MCYAKKMFENMTFVKTTVDTEKSVVNEALSIAKQAPSQTTISRDDKHEIQQQTLHERNKVVRATMSAELDKMNIGDNVANNKMACESKEAQLSVTSVRAAHYNPCDDFLRHQVLSQREIPKFSREGERAQPNVKLDNEPELLANCEENVGHFYIEVSNLGEDDRQTEQCEAVYGSQVYYSEPGDISDFDFYK